MSALSCEDPNQIHAVHVSTVHRANDVRIRIKECAFLVDAGFRVSLIALPSATPLAHADNVTVYELPEFDSRRERFLKAGIAAFRIVKQLKPDVVHFHDPELLPFAPLFRLLKAHVIYDVHEDLPKLILARTWMRPGIRKTVSALASRLEPLFARACSGLVFVDPSWSVRFPSRPLAICRNYPLSREFDALIQVKETNIPSFVYVGDITPERGAYLAAEAITLLDTPARLKLAGPTSSPAVAAHIEGLDTHDRTDFLGVIDRSQVQSLLQSSTAGLVLLAPTAAYENATATKIYEYMGAGLPMILSDTSAHRRIADDHACALIVPFDQPDGVTNAMQQLIDDPQLHAKMSLASRQAYFELPKWEDDFENLERLYTKLIAS